MSRVPRLCPIFRAQPGAYPPETQNRTLRRRAGEQEIRPKPSAAGSVEKGNAAEWTRPAACGKCGKSLKMVKIEGFWTPRRESRINGWRRNRRFSYSQQPAVRTVSMGCAGAAIGACLKEKYARLASEIPQMQTIQGIPARRAADWRIMSKEENRLNFRMSPETAEKLEHWYRQDGCRSKNEFLERAVNYYADHLAAGTSAMLPRGSPVSH